MSQLSAAVRDIETLLKRVELVTPLAQDAAVGALGTVRDLQDRLFGQLRTIVVVVVAGVLAAALIYRSVAERLIVKRG